MHQKSINYIVGFLLIIPMIFLSSCKDVFLRFKYQTIECQENSFDLRKISIKNDKVGSFADVQFGNFYHKILCLQQERIVFYAHNLVCKCICIKNYMQFTSFYI